MTGLGIPLHARDGSIRRVAYVDDTDAALVAGFCWSMNNYGYAVRTYRISGAKRSVLMHRVILGLEHGDPRQADHINGDRLDNRRSNLRVVTNAQNAQNRRAGYGASALRGVSRDGKRWAAFARLNGRGRRLGGFDTEEEAGRAAAAWRAEHMPYSPDAAEADAP